MFTPQFAASVETDALLNLPHLEMNRKDSHVLYVLCIKIAEHMKNMLSFCYIQVY